MQTPHIPRKNPSVVIPEAMLAEVDRAARALDLNRSQAVRDAIRLWLHWNRDRITAGTEQAS